MNKVTLVFGALVSLVSAWVGAQESHVNVYSFRQAELIKPLISQFTAQTGIKVNVVSGKADKLMQRLEQDGDHSFADVLLTTDVKRLHKAKALNLIKPVYSDVLVRNIPETLRGPEHFWFGLSLRARAIFYAKDRVDPKEIQSYQGLIDDKWQGKICARKGSHFYNRSMVASFIYLYGEEQTRHWVQGFTNNLASRPNGGDRDQLRKLAKGECDLAIANSYYYGMLSSSVKEIDRQAYQNVGIIFPRQGKIGTHVNISGAALVRTSKNEANAIKFIEFLTSKDIQKMYANNNYEYPIRHDMPIGETLSSWGRLRADSGSVQRLPLFHAMAEKMIKESNW